MLFSWSQTGTTGQETTHWRQSQVRGGASPLLAECSGPKTGPLLSPNLFGPWKFTGQTGDQIRWV